MNFQRIAAGALAALAITSVQSPALAATDPDLAALRAEVDAMKAQYDAKIADLEARLKAAEAAKAGALPAAPASAADMAQQAAPAPAAEAADPLMANAVDNGDSGASSTAPAGDAPLQTPAPTQVAASAPVAGPNAFNPGIAAVLNGFYAASTHATGNERIPGFMQGGDTGLIPRGFSLGESEISFAANIDPWLAGFLDISFDNQSSPSVEEAYIRTTNLPGGFTVKAGRFLSSIGYLNERHAHDWSFSDAPLPYRAFLNTQYGDDGVQVRWIAPTSFYAEVGAEAFRGDAYPAANGANSGAGTITAFARTGADINASSSYLVAASVMHSRADNRQLGPDAFTGTNDLGIATFVYKWAPGGNPIVRNLALTSELFFSREKGLFNGLPLSQSHFGWYAQGVYQFMPMWSAGLRVAGLDSADPGPAFAGTALDDLGHTPFATTALLEYDTSEFGRLRLQFTRDQTDVGPNNELLFQYTVIFGPHGAHRY